MNKQKIPVSFKQKVILIWEKFIGSYYHSSPFTHAYFPELFISSGSASPQNLVWKNFHDTFNEGTPSDPGLFPVVLRLFAQEQHGGNYAVDRVDVQLHGFVRRTGRSGAQQLVWRVPASLCVCRWTGQGQVSMALSTDWDTLPNRLTLFRIVLVPFTLGALTLEQTDVSRATFFLSPVRLHCRLHFYHCRYHGYSGRGGGQAKQLGDILWIVFGPHRRQIFGDQLPDSASIDGSSLGFYHCHSGFKGGLYNVSQTLGQRARVVLAG